MDTVIVIMLKDRKTGMFIKELETLSISKNEDFLLNIYAGEESIEEDLEEDLEKKSNTTPTICNIYMKITTKDDVSDWEFNAIYDYYDKDIFLNLDNNFAIKKIYEHEDEYNPTWEICFEYEENIELLTERINIILETHKNELEEVFKIISDKQGEYI